MRGSRRVCMWVWVWGRTDEETPGSPCGGVGNGDVLGAGDAVVDADAEAGAEPGADVDVDARAEGA